MKTNGTLVHPEMIEFMHICAISPDGNKEICELVQKVEVTKKQKTKVKKAKKDKELDRDLEDTFPASDPFTHY